MTEEKAKQVKLIETAICANLCPIILNDLNLLSKNMSYGIGLFIGLLIGYLLPPRRKDVHFSKWVLYSFISSVAFFLVISTFSAIWHSR